MKTITIDGKVYVARATTTPAPGERVIELDGVTYTISEFAGTAERVRINGKTYDIADVEAVEAERERAEGMENQIIEWLDEDKRELKANALQYNTLHTTSSVDKISIHGRSISTTVHSFDISSATTEKAGVMSAEDKAKLDSLSQSGGGGVAELMEEVTYSELVALRDNSSLIAGMKYRITDYVTTTVQQDTKSANHPFDIIVEAISENELSELAQAIQHEGDTYFDGNDLSAWQLWYDLDNNTEKYAWADAENGKGVIYRMIDEKRNDCPYDFKNILFYTRKYTSNTTSNEYYYTFSYVVNRVLYDGTVEKQVTLCNSNSMGVYKIGRLRHLNKNTWRNTDLRTGCYSNTFGNNCNSNTFGDSCNSNTFGDNCNSNTFGDNTFKRKLDSYHTSITLNEEYYDDGTNALVPIKHPDLSTQPSILPYKFMGQYVYEQLIPNIEMINSCDIQNTFAVKKPLIISADSIGGNAIMDAKLDWWIDENTFKIGVSGVYEVENVKFFRIVYTSMPEEGDYYGYNNY